ncbi:hypothetical protein HDU67_009585 [Dinochytrium kinnereticum]|nr:hypothetical protein HDU67_009585 [Dinochytrium kinnereticum]
MEYVRRLLRCSSISTQMIVLALLYISRLRELNSKDPIREGAECDLFSTALLLAQKVLDDDRVDNVAWIEYSGVPLVIMNGMEREFLAKIRWQVYVSQTEYHDFIRKLKVIAEELPGGSHKQIVNTVPRPPVTPPPDMDVFEATGDYQDDEMQSYEHMYKSQLKRQQQEQQRLRARRASVKAGTAFPHYGGSERMRIRIAQAGY